MQETDKMKHRSIAFFLAAALLLACLAGCGEQVKVEIKETPAPTEAPAPAETPAESPEETAAPEEADAPEETDDPEEAARKARYQAAYEKFAPDTTVMLVNDEPINWADYYSWVYDIAGQMESTFHVADWNEARSELDGIVPDMTFGSYVRKTALGYVVQIAVILQKAEEMGLEISEEQRADLQATLDGYAQQLGGQEKLQELLKESFITSDYFTRQNEAMIQINNIYQSLYGEKGEKLPEEDAIAYLKDNGYMYAKHILFRTVDNNREKLSDEVIAEKKAEAEAVMAELQQCTAEELPERFDALMQQYNEDTGMLRFPDGYYFHAGEMVPEFENAVRELEGKGLTPLLVESDYGFHIVFCPPMSADHILDYDNNGEPYGPKSVASAALFDNMMNEWFKDAEYNVKYVGDFAELDFNELFGIEKQ